MSIPIFGEIISRYSAEPDSYKMHILIIIPPPKTKKVQSSLGIMNNMSKLSPAMAEICNTL